MCVSSSKFCLPPAKLYREQLYQKRKLINKKTIALFIAICLTVLCCAWPDFHPEKHLGLKYTWQLDVVLHSGYYLLFTLLLRFLFLKKTNVFIFFSLLLVFSLCLELIQAWIPKRSLTLLDVGSNAIGVIFGMFLFRFLKRNFNKSKILNT